MNKLEIVMLRGSSGGAYPFHAHPIHTKLENTGAVYALTNRKSDAGGREFHSIICIGQTHELAETITRHRKTPWLREHDGNCVCLYFEKDKKQRSKMVIDLNQYYSPCVKLVKPIVVSLPRRYNLHP
ncbi:hypothetical protein ACFL4N_01490 [Thermodesulfobacteriota bacterium]